MTTWPELAIPVIDGHNDLAWERRTTLDYSVDGLDQETGVGHTDLPRLRRGGVAGQFWSAWTHTDLEGADSVQATLEQIDFVYRLVARYPGHLALARTADDVRAAMGRGRVASLIGIEGGHQINDSAAVLDSFARLAVRYMTLTWNSTTSWADSAADESVHHGLNDRGREMVARMNAAGMMVDLSHVSVDTMNDALDVSTLPVMFSHSSCAALSTHPRNVPDEVLSRLPVNGGVQMVTFVPYFVSEEFFAWSESDKSEPAPPVTVETVADHVEHAREVAGVDHIGLGGDFDGCDVMPDGLDDVSCYPHLFGVLAARGWSTADLEKLGYRNVLRVLEDNDPAYRALVG